MSEVWISATPWRAEHRGVSGEHDLYDANGKCLDGWRGMFGRGEDARLAAAAPDLYEAARSALAALDAGEGLGFQSGDQAHTALSLALAKAEGRHD